MAASSTTTKDEATTSPISQVLVQLTPQGWLRSEQPHQSEHHPSPPNPKLNITIAINMDSLTPPQTPPHPSPPVSLLPPPEVTTSSPPPTTLLRSTPHPSLPTITSHMENYFLSSWPGLATSPKAAADFKKAKIAVYTALIYPDERIEEEKLSIMTELVALVILLDDWLDTVGAEVREDVVRGLEGVFGRVFGLDDEEVRRRTALAGESEISNSTSVPSQVIKIENNNKNGHSNDAKAVKRQVLFLHESLWSRLIAISPLFAPAVGKVHMQLCRAQASSIRGTHTTMKEYLAFRHTEAGMKVAEVGQYFLVGAEGLAEALLADQECCGGSHVVGKEPSVAEALHALKDCEVLASKHNLLINDVRSYDREVKAQNHTEANGHDRGNRYAQEETEANGDADVALVSAIPLLMTELGLDAEGAKAVIWTTVRQIERCFKTKRAEGLKTIEHFESGRLKAEPDQKFMREVKRVLFGVEARMAGSEQWHFESGRYWE